jgi:NarL family two-component system response regulator LiaR
VLRHLAAGRTNQQIPDELVIAVNTVTTHVANVLSKTGSANRTEAAAYAGQKGLVEA